MSEQIQDKELIYYPSLPKSILLFLGAMSFSALIVWLLLTNPNFTLSPITIFVIILVLGGALLRYIDQIKSNKYILLLTLGILVAIVLLYFIFGGVSILIEGVLLFGAGGLYYGWQNIINRSFTIKLTSKGLDTHYGFQGKISLPWNEIENLEVKQLPSMGGGNQLWLGVHFKNKDKIIKQYPNLGKNNLLTSINQGTLGAPLVVYLGNLTKSPKQITEEVKEYVSKVGISLSES